jgi:hypothetical protein
MIMGLALKKYPQYCIGVMGTENRISEHYGKNTEQFPSVNKWLQIIVQLCYYNIKSKPEIE